MNTTLECQVLRIMMPARTRDFLLEQVEQDPDGGNIHDQIRRFLAEANWWSPSTDNRSDFVYEVPSCAVPASVIAQAYTQDTGQSDRQVAARIVDALVAAVDDAIAQQE